MKSRLSKAKPQIGQFFNSQSKRIYKYGDFGPILRANRHDWNVSKNTLVADFVDFLTAQTKLIKIDLPFAKRAETRFVWREASPLHILSDAAPQGYFSHQTAARLHRLSSEEVARLYFNQEQRRQSNPNAVLTQDAIDRAFSRPQRLTNNTFDLGGFTVCALNGMNTHRLGVASIRATFQGAALTVPVTDLERTLIDLTVRPAYGGGTDQVMAAFKAAKRKASGPTIAKYLATLRYVYPYHQALGFYMQTAGYDSAAIEAMREIPMQFKFYLSPNMSESVYVPEWKLYIPKALHV